MINMSVHGQGVPLVLFHGWGFDSHVWQPLINFPSASLECKLYLVDLPGSGGTENMDFADFKKELLSLLPEKFIVLGWSLGGYYATRLCIEEPERVIKLINVTSSPKFVSNKTWFGMDEDAVNRFYQKFLDDPQHTRDDFVKIQTQIGELQSNKLSEDINIEGLQKGLQILLSADLRAQLAQIQQPVLYLFGKLDAIIPRQTMRSMQKSFPNFSYVMFPKAAHMPFLSHTHEFIELIREFSKCKDSL